MEIVFLRATQRGGIRQERLSTAHGHPQYVPAIPAAGKDPGARNRSRCRRTGTVIAQCVLATRRTGGSPAALCDLAIRTGRYSGRQHRYSDSGRAGRRGLELAWLECGLCFVAPSTRFAGSPTGRGQRRRRTEEHTSELQSLMRNTYAFFCLKEKKALS